MGHQPESPSSLPSDQEIGEEPSKLPAPKLITIITPYFPSEQQLLDGGGDIDLNIPSNTAALEQTRKDYDGNEGDN